MTPSVHAIPAYVNPKSGSADAARDALDESGAFEVREVDPAKLGDEMKRLAAEGVPRMLVAGGDGTIGTAVNGLIGTNAELAILPGGTLNHFATDLGIPDDPKEALSVALQGTARPADVAWANDHVFLNTSSVGAYVTFVRTRERLEKRFGYRIASFIAAIRMFFRLRHIAVEMEVDGERRIFRTPLVFIGVGERELQLPSLGKRVPDGRRGLHVLVVQGRSRARMLAMGFAAVARGVNTAARTPELDSFIVERCTITMKKAGTIAVDGELVKLGAKVEYSLARDAVRVVCP
ncbi:MAG: diacylglycerol kinase family protein [Gemmatimonadaceae bacterium]